MSAHDSYLKISIVVFSYGYSVSIISPVPIDLNWLCVQLCLHISYEFPVILFYRLELIVIISSLMIFETEIHSVAQAGLELTI